MSSILSSLLTKSHIETLFGRASAHLTSIKSSISAIDDICKSSNVPTTCNHAEVKAASFSIVNGHFVSPQLMMRMMADVPFERLEHRHAVLCDSVIRRLDLPEPSSQQQEKSISEYLEREYQGIKDQDTTTPLQCGKRGTTYQPSRRKRVNSHGLEKRLSTPGGRHTLLRRLLKQKRSKLTVDCFV